MNFEKMEKIETIEKNKEFYKALDNECKACKNFEPITVNSTFCKHCLDCSGRIAEAMYLQENEY